MRIKYYAETDTLYIRFNDWPIDETRDFDENTPIDLDEAGNLVAMTIEHASKRAGIPEFSHELHGSLDERTPRSA